MSELDQREITEIIEDAEGNVEVTEIVEEADAD